MSDSMPRLKKRYHDEVVGLLMKEFQFGNPMEVPRLHKVTVNMGLGEAVQNGKIIESAVEELAAITGQKPVVTRARKAIATFKLRQGMPIGVMVTLRKERMWEFADRLISLALPRQRDFKGVSPKGFDGRGNFTLGVKEILIFPEVDIEKLNAVPGMNVCIQTTAKTDDEGRALLKHLGMPFRQA